MKAITTRGARDIDAPNVFEDTDMPLASPGRLDLQVRIDAVAVNPVDTKIRAGALGHISEPTILGWDAVGRVEAVGNDVTHFQPGDRVYYAGEVDRPGCNAGHSSSIRGTFCSASVMPQRAPFIAAATCALGVYRSGETDDDRPRSAARRPGSLLPSRYGRGSRVDTASSYVA